MAKVVSSGDFQKEVLESQEVVLVDFFADWCGPCQAMMPVMDELTSELAGAKVVKINVDDAGDIASQYGVMSIPTFKVFKGGKVVAETMGMQSKDSLKMLVEKHK